MRRESVTWRSALVVSQSPLARADEVIASVSAAAQNVCFWHLTDMTIVVNDVRFRG